MNSENDNNFLLDNYRVLDLTDKSGYLCGKILADLGADVIKVEKPGGDPGRWHGPFYHDIPHPEKSLYWFAYNLNKRGITLDIETSDGCALFKRLVQNADFVIESFAPGYLDGIGLGYSVLSAINPRIIMTSITPFGQTGPRRNWKSSDIVSMATSGFMALTGEPDRPPVRISVDQACFHGCAEGVVASLIADYGRGRTGKGKHIDVSIEASVVVTTINAVPFWDLNSVILNRSGAFRVGLRKGGKQHRQQWSCKDGFVSFAMLGGLAGAESNRALVKWMDSEGYSNDTINQMDWGTYDFSTANDELVQTLESPVANFFLAHTKEELYIGSIERRILLYPVYDTAEIMNSPQLASRGFWMEVKHDELNSVITYPGAFAKSSELQIGAYRRPPLIGEHNTEVYQGELGLSPDELNILAEARVI
ncbi:CaiB/BaiF CoA transferase family protein [Chloroflexota bacterium]